MDHRINVRRMNRERLLFLAHRLLIMASVLVAIGIALTVDLGVETLVGGTVAGVLGALNAAWLAWFWFGLPLLRRVRSDAADE